MPIGASAVRFVIQAVGTIVLMSLLGATGALRGQSGEENWGLCKSDNTEPGIEACTAIIQSGKVPATELAKAFLNRGSKYARKGDYDRAIPDFDQALRINPRFSDAYYGRGWLYEHKGDYNHAIEEFSHALRLNPKLAGASRERGYAYANKGDYPHALQDYDQALRLNPEDSIAFYNRALAYSHQHDYDDAIQDFTHAIELKPIFLRHSTAVPSPTFETGKMT